MRMRPHYVEQPGQHTAPMAILMLVAVGTMLVLMIVVMAMLVAAIMTVMRVAARNVHTIQNAAKSVFPHVTRNTQMQYRRNNEWFKSRKTTAETVS